MPGVQGQPGPATAWRGDWASGQTYYFGDVVTVSGSSYLAPSTIGAGVSPPTAPWAMMAQRGSAWTTGAAVPSAAALPTDMYLRTDGHVWQYTTAWADTGTNITGPQGIQGPAGTVSAAGPGTEALPSIAFAGDTNTGLWNRSADDIGISTGGVLRLVVNNFGTYGASLFALGASPTTADTYLVREAANTLAQRNGTNGQNWWAYGTYIDASNWTRIGLRAAATGGDLVTEKLGSPVAPNIRIIASAEIRLQPGGTNRWMIWSDGNILAGADNAYDFGQPAGSRPRNIYQAGGTFQSYNPGAGIANDGTNYERLTLSWSVNSVNLYTQQGGTGVARALMIGTTGAQEIQLVTNAVSQWRIGVAGGILATTDNANDIGASGANRPRNVYVAGTITAGGTMYAAALSSGINGQGGTNLYLNSAPATARRIDFQTNGLNRWTIMADVQAEAGSNAGSDFTLRAFTDAGTVLSNPMTIVRATGAVTFSGTITAAVDATPVLSPTGNVIEQRNGTNAQTLTAYSTYTDASNYHRLRFGCFGNISILNEAAGTGTTGHMYVGLGTGTGNLFFKVNNTDAWYIHNAGHFGAVTDNVSDIGFAAASRPRNGFFAGAVATGVKAGAAVDADVNTPTDGMLRLDSTNHRLYVRDGAVWRYAQLT